MIEKINMIKDEISNVNSLNMNELKKEDTVLVVVDVIRGFSDVGVLATDRTQRIEKDLVLLNKKCAGCDKIFFIDSHTKESTEFKSFPVHCLENSEETELVAWLKDKDIIDSNSVFIKKNSTNGFHASGFKKWIKNYGHIKNYIITGVCTDICVSNFALTLKTFFDQNNLDKRIIVPTNTVETYDAGSHDADLMNLFTLYNMKTNGIEIVKSVK